MNQREYPSADVEWQKLISLPCHPAMSEEDISYVIYWVKEYFGINKLISNKNVFKSFLKLFHS